MATRRSKQKPSAKNKSPNKKNKLLDLPAVKVEAVRGGATITVRKAGKGQHEYL